MARIVGHLPLEELEARYRAARDATEARHFQAIRLLAQGRTLLEAAAGLACLAPRAPRRCGALRVRAQGRTFLEVAEVRAFVPRWVEQLAARYNAFGPEALGDRRRRNGKAASLLTPELLAALAERLGRAPAGGGGGGGPGGGARRA